MGVKSRKQRRKEARESDVPFEPIYSSGMRIADNGNRFQVGGEPQTHKETYGVGYERFDNGHVKVSEVIDG